VVGLVGLGYDEPPLPVVDVVHPLSVRPRRTRPVQVHPVAIRIVGVDEGLTVVGLSAHPQGLQQLVRRIVGVGDLEAVPRPRGGPVVVGPPPGAVSGGIVFVDRPEALAVGHAGQTAQGVVGVALGHYGRVAPAVGGGHHRPQAHLVHFVGKGGDDRPIQAAGGQAPQPVRPIVRGFGHGAVGVDLAHQVPHPVPFKTRAPPLGIRHLPKPVAGIIIIPKDPALGQGQGHPVAGRIVGITQAAAQAVGRLHHPVEGIVSPAAHPQGVGHRRAVVVLIVGEGDDDAVVVGDADQEVVGVVGVGGDTAGGVHPADPVPGGVVGVAPGVP